VKYDPLGRSCVLKFVVCVPAENRSSTSVFTIEPLASASVITTSSSEASEKSIAAVVVAGFGYALLSENPFAVATVTLLDAGATEPVRS